MQMNEMDLKENVKVYVVKVKSSDQDLYVVCKDISVILDKYKNEILSITNLDFYESKIIYDDTFFDNKDNKQYYLYRLEYCDSEQQYNALCVITDDIKNIAVICDITNKQIVQLSETAAVSYMMTFEEMAQQIDKMRIG